jgi:predicted outer membrane repeat protein
LTIVGSAFTANETITEGGGIHFDSNGGMLDITNSTFSRNDSRHNGGGIAVTGDLTGTTIPPFSAAVSGEADGEDAEEAEDEEGDNGVRLAGVYGYGVQTVDAVTTMTVRLNNVTIAYNAADSDTSGAGDGGGIWITRTLTGTLGVANTILAANTDAGNQAPDCWGGASIVSHGYNVLGNATGCGWTSAAGDQVGTGVSPLDPGLEPLAGSPPYHALEADSPAIDTGNPAAVGGPFPACAAVDQRGVTRPQRAACDVGAYEARELRVYLPIVLRNH